MIAIEDMSDPAAIMAMPNRRDWESSRIGRSSEAEPLLTVR